jgi:hypothetical protein
MVKKSKSSKNINTNKNNIKIVIHNEVKSKRKKRNSERKSKHHEKLGQPAQPNSQPISQTGISPRIPKGTTIGSSKLPDDMTVLAREYNNPIIKITPKDVEMPAPSSKQIADVDKKVEKAEKHVKGDLLKLTIPQLRTEIKKQHPTIPAGVLRSINARNKEGFINEWFEFEFEQPPPPPQPMLSQRPKARFSDIDEDAGIIPVATMLKQKRESESFQDQNATSNPLSFTPAVQEIEGEDEEPDVGVERMLEGNSRRESIYEKKSSPVRIQSEEAEPNDDDDDESWISTTNPDNIIESYATHSPTPTFKDQTSKSSSAQKFRDQTATAGALFSEEPSDVLSLSAFQPNHPNVTVREKQKIEKEDDKGLVANDSSYLLENSQRKPSELKRPPSPAKEAKDLKESEKAEFRRVSNSQNELLSQINSKEEKTAPIIPQPPPQGRRASIGSGASKGVKPKPITEQNGLALPSKVITRRGRPPVSSNIPTVNKSAGTLAFSQTEPMPKDALSSIGFGENVLG